MRKHYKINYKNRPKHYFKDNSIYFITCRTINGQWFLRPNKYKSILLKTIKEKSGKYKFPLVAYVILPNHYHLMIKIDDSSLLWRLIREINGASSRNINKADFVIDRKIWWNYYDHLIRGDTDFYKHLNYIHQNPIKHGVSTNFDYQFSSYNAWIKDKGKQYLDHSFKKYPVVDFTIKGDNV